MAAPREINLLQKNEKRKDIQKGITQIKQYISHFLLESPPNILVGKKANILSQNVLQWLRKKGNAEEKAFYPEVLFLRGKVLVMLGQYSEAIKLLEDEKEKAYFHWELLGVAYLKTRQYEKTKDCCNAIFQEQPQYMSTHPLKAYVSLLQNRHHLEFETSRLPLIQSISSLAAIQGEVKEDSLKNEFWFEMMGVFLWNNHSNEVAAKLASILQKLEDSSQNFENFDIAIFYGFMAHIHFMNRNYADAEKFSKKCEDYLGEIRDMIANKDERDQLPESNCDYIQFDLFFTHYIALIRANFHFFKKDYEKAKHFAKQSKITSEYFQDWVHCLQQNNPFFMMDVKPCANYFSLCDSLGYDGIDSEKANQAKNLLVTALEEFMKNKYRSKEVNLAFLKTLSEIEFSTGGTLLHIAARLRSLNLLKLFLSEDSLVDVNMKDNQGMTALDHAFLMKKTQPGKAAEIFDKSISLLRAKQAKTAQELQPASVDLSLSSEAKRESVDQIAQPETKEYVETPIFITQPEMSPALTTTATLLSSFTASATTASVGRDEKQDERYNKMEQDLQYFRRKARNLSNVVAEAVNEVAHLNSQLDKAAETQQALQTHVQYLERTVASLFNTNQNLLQNPTTLFTVTPLPDNVSVVVIEGSSASSASSSSLIETHRDSMPRNN